MRWINLQDTRYIILIDLQDTRCTSRPSPSTTVGILYTVSLHTPSCAVLQLRAMLRHNSCILCRFSFFPCAELILGKTNLIVLLFKLFIPCILIRFMSYGTTGCAHNRVLPVNWPACLCVQHRQNKVNTPSPLETAGNLLFWCTYRAAGAGYCLVQQVHNIYIYIYSYWMTLRTGEDTVNWRRKL